MRRLTLLGALAVFAILLGASAAVRAQEDGRSPAQRLSSPVAGEPAPAAASEPAAEPSLDDVDVPEPPGSARAREDEVRYPVPSPRQAARRALEGNSLRIPSRITTRLRALDANLQALAARGGGNIVNAVLSLLTGGLAITLGALREPNDDWMSIYLYVYGGTAAARGILDFVLTPNAQGAAITYQHMPMTSREEVQERLEFGERALSGLAEQSLIARVLDASLNMAAGVAVIPIYLVPNDFTVAQPLDYFILIGAGVSIISGIITLATTSAAEQRWGAYQELRERLETEDERERRERRGRRTRASAPSLHFSATPSPTGGFAGLSGAF